MTQTIKSNKGWLCAIFILLKYTCTVYGLDVSDLNINTQTDSIRTYLNDDKHYDLVVLESDDEMHANLKLTICFGTENGSFVTKKDISFIHEGITCSPNIEVDSAKNICIEYFHYKGGTYRYTYKYIKSSDDWFLYHMEEEDEEIGGVLFSSSNIWPLYETRAIGNETGEWVNIVTKRETDSLTQKLNKQYKQFLEEHKSKTYKEIYNYKLEEYYAIVRYIGINDSNVQKLNDIGFFLCEAKCFDVAVKILEGIKYRYRERTVAYINLGDAYWGLEEKDNASQAYQKYIELMKASGKECKIPKRVFERIKE